MIDEFLLIITILIVIFMYIYYYVKYVSKGICSECKRPLDKKGKK